MTNLTIDLDLKDKETLERVANHYGIGLEEATRKCIQIAGGVPLCPYCDSPLEEYKFAGDKGTSEIWICPECAEGNGEVVIKT
ncbi:hypothetical protein [Anaerolinea sp.]|uniref:hypothetical protein n=1 Tax=Anaerolinea sp. TaxID=1872519 RepID=UPI002ACDAB04|nr:hypothetical protein [Anaerolinea sp.]